MIFNRPEKTEAVFDAIKKIQPRFLYIISDGPRFAEEEEKCIHSREIFERVDWDCLIKRDFSPVNLGCKKRISSGLNWVFSECEEAIILEDDCVPDLSFFPYCEALLKKYRNDSRILMISGDNFQKNGNWNIPYSYYFSIYPHVWGWATWARSWKYYDVKMSMWPELRSTSWLTHLFNDDKKANYWRSIFDSIYRSEIDSWDYQLTFTAWIHNMLSIVPSKNLVANIGFDNHGSHTKVVEKGVSNLPTHSISFPLTHPPYLFRDYLADEHIDEVFYSRKSGSPKSVFYRIVKRFIPKPILSEIKKRRKN